MTARRKLADFLPDDLTIDDFVWEFDNETRLDKKAALAYLLLKGEVHAFTVRLPSEDEDVEDETADRPERRGTRLAVNTSDTFAWGYSNFDDFASDGDTQGDLYLLLTLTLDNPKWGATKWICIKEQSHPQSPIVRDMIAEGVWDETMRALPHNEGDDSCCDWHHEMAEENRQWTPEQERLPPVTFDDWRRI